MIDCQKAAERLYEYIDRELDHQTAAEIEEHLKLCGPCFKEYDLEAKLKEFVQRKAAACPGTDELKARILAELQKIASEPVKEESKGKRVLLWGGGLAAAAAVVLLFLFGLPDFGTGPDPMVVEAASEHMNHLAAVHSALPIAISMDSVDRVLSAQLGFNPEIDELKNIEPNLRDFHTGPWMGKPAACLFLVPEDGQGISILICEDANGWMPKGKAMTHNGHKMVLVSHEGCNMLFWVYEGKLCCTVGKCSEQELLKFAWSV